MKTSERLRYLRDFVFVNNNAELSLLAKIADNNELLATIVDSHTEGDEVWLNSTKRILDALKHHPTEYFDEVTRTLKREVERLVKLCEELQE